MSTKFWIIPAALMTALTPIARGEGAFAAGMEAVKNTEPWTAVEALKNDGDVDLACTRAQRLLESDFSIGNAKQLLKLSHEISDTMENKVTRSGPILFEKPSAWSFSCNEDARALKIPLPDTAEVNKNMAVFDAQKAALLALLERVTESRLANPNSWNKEMKGDVETELRRVANIRCRYLSYMVVSPYLYETHRRAFIARGFINDSESGLRNAGKVIAKGLSLAWLYQSADSVKDQYLEVVEYLHANCEGNLWNAILTDTAIIKSINEHGIKDAKATKENTWLNLP